MFYSYTLKDSTPLVAPPFMLFEVQDFWVTLCSTSAKQLTAFSHVKITDNKQ